MPLAECSSVSRTTNKGGGDQVFLAQVAGYMERRFRVSCMALNVSTGSLPTFSVLDSPNVLCSFFAETR